ncbi:MAG: hypothetical protein ABSC29_02105 [Minisyncoccia bacterium]|jgi:hypothetical protein
MIVYVFGNPDLPADSLPLRILPELQKRFPQVQFEVKDPNEEWDVPEELTIIDTVEGINEVTVFDDLAKFAAVPRVTMHDFDALTNLRYLQKLGKFKKIKIIGVPGAMDEAGALQKIIILLEKFLSGQ